MGALTENHRCPRGVWSRLTDAASTLSIGSLAGVGFCYVINERPTAALVVATAALGAVLATAVRQAVSGKSS